MPLQSMCSLHCSLHCSSRSPVRKADECCCLLYIYMYIEVSEPGVLPHAPTWTANLQQSTFKNKSADKFYCVFIHSSVSKYMPYNIHPSHGKRQNSDCELWTLTTNLGHYIACGNIVSLDDQNNTKITDQSMYLATQSRLSFCTEKTSWLF